MRTHVSNEGPSRRARALLAPRLSLLTVALALLMPGCAGKKMAGDMPSPGGAANMGMAAEKMSYGDEDYGGDYEEMDMAEGDFADDAGPPPEPGPAPADEAPALTSKASAKREFKRSEPAKPKPTGGAKMKKGKDQRNDGAEEGGESTEETSQPEEVARRVIYTAGMTVGVFKVEEALEKAEQVTLLVGGYVQSMSNDTLVLRIPAAELRNVMDEFATYGVVEARSLHARDVTEEYVDLRSRIRVLTETRDQLRLLLKKTRTVEEALEVRKALDRVNMELEQALARMRVLEQQIAFSTLTLRFSERGPHADLDSSNDPFPWVNDLGVEATEWH